jgi:hypothetical protein
MDAAVCPVLFFRNCQRTRPGSSADSACGISSATCCHHCRCQSTCTALNARGDSQRHASRDGCANLEQIRQLGACSNREWDLWLDSYQSPRSAPHSRYTPDCLCACSGGFPPAPIRRTANVCARHRTIDIPVEPHGEKTGEKTTDFPIPRSCASYGTCSTCPPASG